jgi:hypothetical protein
MRDARYLRMARFLWRPREISRHVEERANQNEATMQES